MDRRTFLKGTAFAGLGLAGLGGSLLDRAASAVAATPRASYAGTTLTVITQTGPYIASAVQRFGPVWEKQTGGKVNLITVPFGELYSKITTALISGANTYDVLLFPADYTGDWVSYLVPLDRYIEKDKTVDWNGIAPAVKQGASWNGSIVSMPIDGDNQIAYYRRDVIEDRKWAAPFKKEFGYDLAPPTTWRQFLDIAKFFSSTGKHWPGDGSTGYGVVEAYKRGGQAFWFFMSNCVAYTALPDMPGGGLYFNPNTMEPLINNPGHLEALKNYVEAVAYGPPGMVNYDSGDVRSAFAAGKAVLAIDWDDTGIVAELTPGSKARGKTASMLLPGSTKVWDYRKNAWVTMSTPNRPAWLAFNGWKGGIPNSTPKKDAAYNFIAFLASPKISLEEVTMAGSGMNPYRYEHFTDRAAWVKAGYPSSGKDLDEYLRAMYGSETSSNAVTDLRIPGAASFQDAVELNTSRAAAKQTSPQDALNAIADAWKGINARYGTKKQIQAFKASNAPIKAPLNKSTPPKSIPSYLK